MKAANMLGPLGIRRPKEITARNGYKPSTKAGTPKGSDYLQSNSKKWDQITFSEILKRRNGGGHNVPPAYIITKYPSLNSVNALLLRN